MFYHTVQTLADEPRIAGNYSLPYSTSRMGSGLYIAEVRLAHDLQCKLIVVVK